MAGTMTELPVVGEQGFPVKRGLDAEGTTRKINPHLFILAGASNVGKTTLASHLVQMLTRQDQDPESIALVRKVTTKDTPRAREDPGLRVVELNDYLTLEDRGQLLFSGQYAGKQYGIRRDSILPLKNDRILITANDEDFVNLVERTGDTRIPTIPILLTAHADVLAARSVRERGDSENAVRLKMLSRSATEFETNIGVVRYFIDTTSLADILETTTARQPFSEGHMQVTQRTLALASMVTKLDQLAAIVRYERSLPYRQDQSPAQYINGYFERGIQTLFKKSIEQVTTDDQATVTSDNVMQHLEQQGYPTTYIVNCIVGLQTHRVWRDGTTLHLEYQYSTTPLAEKGLSKARLEPVKMLERKVLTDMFRYALQHRGYETSDAIVFKLSDVTERRLPGGHKAIEQTNPVYALQVSFVNGNGPKQSRLIF